MKKIFLFFLFVLVSINSFSQNKIFNRTPCEQVHIPVCIHIIAFKLDSFKDYSLDIRTIKQYFDYLKKDCIYLDICKIDSIRDYNYYNLSDEDKSYELIELVNMYHLPYSVNIYINETLDDATYLGIGKSNQDTSYIAFSPTALKFPYVARKLILKYFGLRNTSTNPPLEFADGTNGETTQDSIWDTPADPSFLNPKYQILPPLFIDSKRYLYIESPSDPKGDKYNVMYDNIMSYYSLQLGTICDKLTRNQWQQLGYNESRNRYKRWKVEK